MTESPNGGLLDFEEIDLDKINFKGKNAGLAWKLEQAGVNIKIARYILYFLGVIMCFPVLYTYFFIKSDLIMAVIGLLLALPFLLGGFYIKKYPILAISIPLLLYCVYIAILFLGLGARIGAWDIALAVIMGIGLYNAVKASKIRKQLTEAVRKDPSLRVYKTDN